MAHEQLTAKALQKLKDSGEYEDAMMRTKAWELYNFNSGFAPKAIYKIKKAGLRAQGLSPSEISERFFSGPRMEFPFNAKADLKPSGTVRTVTILIDFSDYRADTLYPNLRVSNIQENIYGNGTSAAQKHMPYESVSAYYRRASEGKVDLKGTVLGWYHFPNKRDSYKPKTTGLSDVDKQNLERAAIFRMAKEALDSFNPTHDFSQYDNDNDGNIDVINILYAGPMGSWNSFWWAYRWYFLQNEEVEKTQFDGKRLNQFVFQYVNTRDNGADFDPSTLLHETGHAFGLPDYYDYDPEQGPSGGIGGLDMMDANWGNHNAFSRWLLDWIKPEIVAEGPPKEHTLVAAGSSLPGAKAIAVFPGITNSNAPGQEMFIIENRFRIGNDSAEARMPNNGLLIWHVQGKPNGDNNDFLFNNSFSDHKLVQLLRADSGIDFDNEGRAGPGTYFNTGSGLTPDTSPNSNDFSGQRSNLVVTDISEAGESMKFKVGFSGLLAPDRQRSMNNGVSEKGTNTTGGVVASTSKDFVDVEQVEKLLEEYGSASPEQLNGAWRAANETSKPGNGETKQSMVVKKLILAQWAGKSGLDAINALVGTQDQRLLAECYASTLDAWANNQPRAAADWFFKDKLKPSGGGMGLAANQSFTRTIFRHSAMLDLEGTVAKVDRLQSLSEIKGALDGIDDLGTLSPTEAQAVNAAENNLKKNRGSIRALRLMTDAFRILEKEGNINPSLKAEANNLQQTLQKIL